METILKRNSLMTEKSLAGRFLVASPSMKDPVFSKTVLFMVGHDDKMGALGLVINRETNVTLAQACEQLKFPCRTPDAGRFLGWGGPVAGTRGFIVHSPAVVGEDPVIFHNETVAVGSSLEMMRAIASGEGPSQYFIALGCAGWTPGQLEQEIATGGWLDAPWDARIIYDLPVADRYEAALAAVGMEEGVFDKVPAAFCMTGIGHA